MSKLIKSWSVPFDVGLACFPACCGCPSASTLEGTVRVFWSRGCTFTSAISTKQSGDLVWQGSLQWQTSEKRASTQQEIHTTDSRTYQVRHEIMCKHALQWCMFHPVVCIEITAYLPALIPWLVYLSACLSAACSVQPSNPTLLFLLLLNSVTCAMPALLRGDCVAV